VIETLGINSGFGYVLVIFVAIFTAVIEYVHFTECLALESIYLGSNVFLFNSKRIDHAFLCHLLKCSCFLLLILVPFI